MLGSGVRGYQVVGFMMLTNMMMMMMMVMMMMMMMIIYTYIYIYIYIYLFFFFLGGGRGCLAPAGFRGKKASELQPQSLTIARTLSLGALNGVSENRGPSYSTLNSGSLL